MLRELEDMGVTTHFAVRESCFVRQNWADKTPMRMSIAYLVADFADREIMEIWAGKRFQFGY